MNTIEILKKHSIKVTKPRMAIYELLEKEHTGIGADYIYSTLLKENLSINLSTVYRTLELFEEKNLIQKYDLGEKKYNFSLIRHGHHHIVECDSCHKVINLDCPMKQIEDLITKETGFHLTEHHLELKGICKDCLEKKKH
ncbi:Fur family transcriptional regulator [Proteiniclasticum ruminis]|uniref:Fe2+ or Zn2+ uptake regulation protein n=1 Tax=Proteiniclasticum ruminis TaxID=398199 RepID=A0A1G8PQM1_9CLOT|nr:Fur family transcriptional regulator [Proteiniclasticum ruminis]SDI94811.1 Fe2+ or Zn2+ uptake regulation protein [Proteiniclasticum ruminis]